MAPPDVAAEQPPLTDEQLMRLKLARIVPRRYGLRDWHKFIYRRVSPEKAARYLGWYTERGAPDVERLKNEIAERNFLATPHGEGYIITVADLVGYEAPALGVVLPPPGELPSRKPWLLFFEEIKQRRVEVAAFLLPLTIALVALLAELVDIRPPRAVLTIVLDASAPMGRLVGVDRTLWDVALDIAQSKLPDPRYHGEKHAQSERIAIWIERGIPASGGCVASHNRLTTGYVSSDGLALRALAAHIQPTGLPNPGPALREAMRDAPNNLLFKTSHRAVILTSGAQTCSGKLPAEEICEVLRNELWRWTTFSTAQISHDVIILELQGTEIRPDIVDCQVNEPVAIRHIVLDPQRPEESNSELCKLDARACDQPAFPTSTPTATPPAPSTVLPNLTTPTPSSLAPTPPPPVVPVLTLTPTLTPTSPQPRTPSPVPTGEAATPSPTATPVFAVRVPYDRRVAVREGCNQGRVIGDIGMLPTGQFIEALVPVIPNDFMFLESDGCLRVYTGILGDPYHGYPGFVRADEVCVVPYSYAYWRDHPAFASSSAEKWLQVCEN